jgi:curved DNA-binding protein CbpA
MGASSQSDTKAIEAKANAILSADHFSALGVTKTSSADDVQRAFLDAVKNWHPDRVPPGLEAMRPLYARVFGRLTAAKATLVDPERRVRYLEDLTKSRGKLAIGGEGMVTEAMLELKKAEVLIKKNDLAQAEQLLRRAAELAPDNLEIRVRLLGLQVKPSTSPEELKRIAGELDAVIAKDAKSAKAFMARAQVRKQLGLNPQAHEDFEQVVRLEPGNIDAAREVRLYNMRKDRATNSNARPSSPDPADGGEGAVGFFKKLFKR